MMYVDKLLIFDIKGSMAHFRKFYTNSSSLSYTFPPRTTIIGLIAGILGIERDEYYEEFGSEKCRIAVSIKTPVRKIMQTVNYVQTKKDKGGIKAVNLSARHTQIPLEIILPLKSFDQIRYRVYIYHNGEIFNKFKEILETGKFVYPPYLGISEFIAEIKFVDFIKKGENHEIEKLSNPFDPVEIVTVVNAKQISKGGLIFERNFGETLQYVKERMPVEFDSERKIKRVASFIYEKKYNITKLRIKGDYYRISYQNSRKGEIVENIVFME